MTWFVIRYLKHKIDKMSLIPANFDKIIKNGGLTYGACLLSVIIMPVYIHLLPPVMILWVLFLAWERKMYHDTDAERDKKALILFFLFLLFYMWQISGLLWTHSINTGLERLIKRLSFILFPLVLFYPGSLIQKNIKLIIRLFALGTFVYVLFCFGQAIAHSLIHTENKLVFSVHPTDYEYENFFIGMRFSFPVHPSYLAMYIVISVLILLESLFDSSVNLIIKSLFSLSVIVLLIALYLLSARAGIIAGIVIFPTYCFAKLYDKMPKWILLLLIAAIALAFTIVAVNNDKVGNFITGVSKDNINKTLKTDPRMLIWQSAAGVIKKHPVLGVGTGDATRMLKDEFVSRGFFDGYYDNLNAHNQFLEIWIENGVIGLIIFFSILAYMIFISVKQRNILLALFIITIIIFFLFETMLNRIAGVSFFALLTFLLINIGEKCNAEYKET